MNHEIASAPPQGVPGRPGRTGVIGAVRRIAVGVIGGAVLVAGVALIVLPGPAFLVIPAGLAILATEFPWARRLLRYARERAAGLLAPLRRRAGRPPSSGWKGEAAPEPWRGPPALPEET